MRKPHHLIALLLTASTLALTGCSRNPVAPDVNAPADPGASPMVGVREEEKEPVFVGEGGASGSMRLESGEAGVLTVGRWSVTVHKNSHIDAATIALTVTDPQSMEVQIEVIPASENLFQVPIELVANMSDQQNILLEEHAIQFWNGGWEQAADMTWQMGESTLKAKTTHLTNARVGSAVEVVKGKGK
jgi:hypothetical protein